MVSLVWSSKLSINSIITVYHSVGKLLPDYEHSIIVYRYISHSSEMRYIVFMKTGMKESMINLSIGIVFWFYPEVSDA